MSDSKRAKFVEHDASPDLKFSDKDAAERPRIDARRIRKVSPIGMRVLVRLQRDSNVSEGGLYLPEGAKSNMTESVLAEVLEVATASEHGSDDEANISGVPLGATVLVSKNAGVKVPWDDNLRIVETKEVLAIVHEVSLI